MENKQEITESTRKILFLTMVNMTNNPRLVKEMDLARELGYEITLIAFNLGNWSDKIEENYKIKFKYCNIIYIDATRKKLFEWFWCVLQEIIYSSLFKRFKNNLRYAGLASRRSIQIIKRLKNIGKFDLIASHTMDTLYPAFLLSKKNNTPFYFDMEDYHPGEEEESSLQQKRKELLLKKILPFATYLSYASPLIGRAALNLVGEDNIQTHFYISNSFWSKEFIEPKSNKYDKLKLVWFSLTISENRGLEQIIEIIKPFKNEVVLTLIGGMRKEFYNTYVKNNLEFINVIEPLSQEKLHLELSNHDIGLALEQKTINTNRSICLTNKLFAYCQAGLYVLATETPAQQLFFEKNKQYGELISSSTTEIVNVLRNLIVNKSSIRRANSKRYKMSMQSLSFDIESLRIVENWKKI